MSELELDTFDMKCGSVPTFVGKASQYIDPNNTGKIIHEEIKETLNTDIYPLLKKILVTSRELDEHYEKKPIYTTKSTSIADTKKRNIAIKKFNEKLNSLLDTAPNRFSTPSEFCNTFDFNDEEHQIPPGTGEEIPLLDTIQGKQVVLGRQRNLTDYYHDKTNFVTLNSKFWDTKSHLNYAFIECAQIKANEFTERNKFPIRMVLSKNLFNEPDKFLNINNYDPDYTKTTVLAQELCQFLEYTDSVVVQSIEHPNIFFIGRSGSEYDSTKFRQISSSSRDDRYILKYYKYKQKYLELKKALQDDTKENTK